MSCATTELRVEVNDENPLIIFHSSLTLTQFKWFFVPKYTQMRHLFT